MFAGCYDAAVSMTPNIKLPPGMSLRETENGFEVYVNKEPLTKTVAFRLTASDYVAAMSLVECFPDKSWGAAMRWLLQDATVRAVINERIINVTRQRSEKTQPDE